MLASCNSFRRHEHVQDIAHNTAFLLCFLVQTQCISRIYAL